MTRTTTGFTFPPARRRRMSHLFGHHRACRLLAAIAIAGLLSLVLASQAAATIVTFNMNYEFSGGTPPFGSPPWVVVTLNDFGGSGSVQLDVTAPGMTTSEYIKELMLNLDTTMNPTLLSFAFDAKSRVALVAPAQPLTILTGVDSFMADGDGKYDIELDFATGAPAGRFTGGDYVRYTISGIPTLTATSFKFLSAPAGGHGPYVTAAHILNTPDGGGFSGWVTDITGGSETVPEPSTVVLAALGACTILGQRVWRLRRRK